MHLSQDNFDGSFWYVFYAHRSFAITLSSVNFTSCIMLCLCLTAWCAWFSTGAVLTVVRFGVALHLLGVLSQSALQPNHIWTSVLHELAVYKVKFSQILTRHVRHSYAKRTKTCRYFKRLCVFMDTRLCLCAKSWCLYVCRINDILFLVSFFGRFSSTDTCQVILKVRRIHVSPRENLCCIALRALPGLAVIARKSVLYWYSSTSWPCCH